MLTGAQRRQRARLGGLATAARGNVNTKASHDAFLARFEREVDPEGLLPPEERAKRALAARKAHMGRLALRSSLTRSKRKAAPAIVTPETALEARRARGKQPTAA